MHAGKLDASIMLYHIQLCMMEKVASTVVAAAVGFQHTGQYVEKMVASTVVAGAVGCQHTGQYVGKTVASTVVQANMLGKWLLRLWLLVQ